MQGNKNARNWPSGRWGNPSSRIVWVGM